MFRIFYHIFRLDWYADSYWNILELETDEITSYAHKNKILFLSCKQHEQEFIEVCNTSTLVCTREQLGRATSQASKEKPAQ
jgi:hypothetical protein